MKVIICGTRTTKNYLMVMRAVLSSGFTITEVVSGKDKGADLLGECYAMVHKLPVKPFPADWDKYGPPAGPIRNQQMANYADACLAIWDGKSPGTLDMLKKAKKKGLKIFIYPTEKGLVDSEDWRVAVTNIHDK